MCMFTCLYVPLAMSSSAHMHVGIFLILVIVIVVIRCSQFVRLFSSDKMKQEFMTNLRHNRIIACNAMSGLSIGVSC